MDVTVAVFDVDKTLTVRDCVVPFMFRVAGVPRILIGLLSRLPSVLKGVFSRDRDTLKQIFVDVAFAGRAVDEVEQDGIVFAELIAQAWLRDDVVARMRWHQEQGHVVLLVSASLGVYLHPFGDLCEVDDVLCTELEHSDGVYTGRLIGNNCRGQEKVTRIAQWCVESNVPLDHIVFAYGDSAGDGPMLQLAEHGVLVKDLELELAHS